MRIVSYFNLYGVPQLIIQDGNRSFSVIGILLIIRMVLLFLYEFFM